MLKNENKQHQKHRSDKENRRDLIPGNRDRKAAADMVVKGLLLHGGILQVIQKILMSKKMCLWLLLHEEETVFNEMFALMAHTENEEEDNQVTLLDMKNDLDKYSLKN